MATGESIIATLRAHEPQLRAAGVRSLSLFGSAARGDFRSGSDIDLAVEIDSSAHLGLRFFALQRRLTELLGEPVDLLAEPIENPRLRANLERDRRRVF
jgi:predicted nucleotidyltransferase